MTLEEINEKINELKAEKNKIIEEEEKRLQAEKEDRYDEVKVAYENYLDLRSKFIEDYGSIELHYNRIWR